MGDFDGEQKELIKKLVNFRMIDGKRTRVRAIVYKTFHRLARTERDVIKLMGLTTFYLKIAIMYYKY
jgi:small subunit ribosomal protein S7